ncbi:MAG: hypothetical protein IT210_05135 [Armatimonadetes bacterium]|nr:hypothetical protein [Armatimonadota bacterium]
MRCWLACVIGFVVGSIASDAQEIGNDSIRVRPVKEGAAYTGFVVRSDGQTVASVAFSTDRLVTADRCAVSSQGNVLTFTMLKGKAGSGLALGVQDYFTVALRPEAPAYPYISFRLNFKAFDAARWQAVAGKQPFHFLTLSLSEADCWHHRGWLNATPYADPFPLLLDTHVGTPEISAYPYNRQWSYTPPLGAHPIPVIGLWDSRAGQYAGLELQTTRLQDNSERDVATGYRWKPADLKAKARQEQFVALVYPFGGTGYQQLVFPKAGQGIASRGALLWSRSLPASDDPNRFFWTYLWEQAKDRLPPVPETVDLSWVPGGLRLKDFGGPAGGSLIGGVEGSFQVPGTKLISGWGWHNESPTAAAARQGDAARLQAMDTEAQALLRYAKRFKVKGEECVYWEKPLEGAWTPEWGGKAATTLHNANGFAAGRLFLGLYRDFAKKEYLDIANGVLNWAKYIAWTRNEFADVPSSPFAIGGTLSASFCLDFYMTFKDSAEEALRNQARRALELARAFTYRYMILWPSDNNRYDNLDSAFLWEPNSGRDWTGAACANEVFWNLDTLAQTAVHTGDPVLMWALQGSLSRWHLLYRESYRDSLADYIPSDMTEGYGLYAGNVYGVGMRAGYGFSSPLFMTEPVGDSVVRVLAGEKAAMVFNKEGAHTSISDYRYNPDGHLSFNLRSRRPRFDLSLTVPYVDISRRSVYIVRNGGTGPLTEGRDFIRPPHALWSLYIKNLRNEDRILIGEPDENGTILPSLPPLTEGVVAALPAGSPYQPIPLPHTSFPDSAWSSMDNWVGLPQGRLWAWGVPFDLAPVNERRRIAEPVSFAAPVAGPALLLAYSAGGSDLPSVLLSDGSKQTADSATEALAWRAWPPVYTARLLVNLFPLDGKSATGIDPGGRTVWAATLIPPGQEKELPNVIRRLQAGAAQWQRERREEAAIAALKDETAAVPPDSVAILPPNPGGPAINLMQRVGLGSRSVFLSGEQLADPAFFNVRRFPAAVYAGGEEYLHTVRSPGDAAEAVARYVQKGGTLLLLSPGPFPLYYANGPGFHRAEPLTDRLGVPIYNAIEAAPKDALTVQAIVGQTALPELPERFPFPPGDPRLRSIDRSRLPQGAHYTPIYTVRGSSGKLYGDAGGLVSLPGGKGRILYLWGGLLHDPENGPAVQQAALRFLMAAVRRSN